LSGASFRRRPFSPPWCARAATPYGTPIKSPEARAVARLEHQRIEIITNEAITEAEAGWLCERIGRDGRLTPNEAALVAYLKQESPAMHPDLQAAVDRLARAA
jgi:hypothetical protein